MTAGETWDSCLDEIRNLPAVKKYGDDVKVSMYMYDRPSWTGEVYETECLLPPPGSTRRPPTSRPWWTPTRPCLVTSASAMPTPSMDAMHLGSSLSDKWTFSTNCVSIQGRYGIPCVGFGPGAESQAHAPNEVTSPGTTWSPLPPCTWLPLNLYDPSQADGDATVFRAGLTNNKID